MNINLDPTLQSLNGNQPTVIQRQHQSDNTQQQQQQLQHQQQQQQHQQQLQHQHQQHLQQAQSTNPAVEAASQIIQQQQLIHNQLIPSIPPLNNATSTSIIVTQCSRCKKEFTQHSNKKFKLCTHCRDLQRQRSRRWQEKTKQKNGACRRCGNDIPLQQSQYVLCPVCRENLRSRKANRAAQGKCVHCSGPNDNLSSDYKVCQRCRNNDKIRRTNLEKIGHCNRCAKPLGNGDLNNHKVCGNCRNRKKKIGEFGGANMSNSSANANSTAVQAVANLNNFGFKIENSNEEFLNLVGLNMMQENQNSNQNQNQSLSANQESHQESHQDSNHISNRDANQDNNQDDNLHEIRNSDLGLTNHPNDNATSNNENKDDVNDNNNLFMNPEAEKLNT